MSAEHRPIPSRDCGTESNFGGQTEFPRATSSRRSVGIRKVDDLAVKKVFEICPIVRHFATSQIGVKGGERAVGCRMRAHRGQPMTRHDRAVRLRS